jgi:hypothetical protein
MIRLIRRAFCGIPHTFVSSYYEVSNYEIKDFFSRYGLEFKETANGFAPRYCPICPKPHYEDRTNLYTLNFKHNSGIYHCFRCGASGNWYDFKGLMLGGNTSVAKIGG